MDPRSAPDDAQKGSSGAAAVEPEPSVAGTVFGDRIAAARRYAQLLTGPGVDRGLVGPREAARIWTRHLLNCAVVGDLVIDGTVVADVGSGAGLPGIPLALSRPAVSVVLVEPLLRRATFLSEVVEELEVTNVRVVRARAEDLASRPSPTRRSAGAAGPLQPGIDAGVPGWQPVDVVTSRAVAPLERLAGWCVPLLRPGGMLLAMKGSSAADEVRAAGAALTRLGLTGVEVVTAGAGVLDEPTTLVRARLAGPARSRSASKRR